MEKKENQIIFVDESGKEVACEVLFTYESPEYKKNYVFFVDPSTEDEDGKVEVGVASYTEKDGGVGELFPVEDDAEWDMLAEVFEAYASEEECDCNCDCDCEDECDDDCDCCCGHHHCDCDEE